MSTLLTIAVCLVLIISLSVAAVIVWLALQLEDWDKYD